MLLIRSSQMDAFNANSMKQYKRALCDHLKQYHPSLCETAGDGGVKKLVDIGVSQARECGFTSDGPIRLYLEIMLSLGSEFHSDPQYYWLGPWLQPQDCYQEMDRARYLQFHTVRYLDDVQGPNEKYRIENIEKIQSVAIDKLNEIDSSDHAKVIGWLELIHPVKCLFIGRKALELLIELARKEAGVALSAKQENFLPLLDLMVIYGSGVLRDPMHPEATGKAIASLEKV